MWGCCTDSIVPTSNWEVGKKIGIGGVVNGSKSSVLTLEARHINVGAKVFGDVFKVRSWGSQLLTLGNGSIKFGMLERYWL